MERSKEIIKDEEGFKLPRIINSAVLFTIAFMLSNLYMQIFIAFFSKIFGYGVVFTYNKVTSLPVPTPTDIVHWNFSSIIVIYFIAPSFCFATGFMLLLLALRKEEINNRFRLFIFWLIVCLPNIFLAQILFGPFGLQGDSKDFYLTFAIVGTWLNMSFMVMIIFALLAIITTIIWGVVMGQELTMFSSSSRFSATIKSRVLLAVQLYLIPLVLGSVPIIFLSRLSSIQPTVIILLNLVALGVGILLRSSTHKASVNLRKQGVYLGAIEMNTRGGSGSGSRRGRDRSLSNVPVPLLIIAGIIWGIIFIFLR